MRRRNTIALLILLAVIMLAVSLLLALRQPSSPAVSPAMVTPGATGTDANYIATVAFEDTAVAIFTLNPTLALSSTPYFAEIIYNDVLRNIMTEVPYPRRPCYLDPTIAPTYLSQAIPPEICGTMLATPSTGYEEYSRLVGQLISARIKGTISLTTVGYYMMNTDEPFVPVYSKVYVDIELISLQDHATVNDQLTRMVSFLVENWDSIEFAARNSEIYLQFVAPDGSSNTSFTFDQLLDAYVRGLTGDNLLKALGGIQTTPTA